MDNKRIIYTLGYTLFQSYAGIDVDSMFRTLQHFNISYLVDVRSVPYSKQYPQCNAEALRAYGRRYNVPYVHMPELGAKADPSQDVFSKASDIFFDDIFPIAKSNRPEKTELNAWEEIVDFRKFRHAEFFTDGLKRIETAYDKGFTLALMCSEKNPMECHRYFFASKSIEQRFCDWITIEHIIQNEEGQITTIPNSALDKKLEELILNKNEIKKLDIQSPSFFGPSRLDNYFGDTPDERLKDFCDRYWNLMHGWKKMSGTNYNND